MVAIICMTGTKYACSESNYWNFFRTDNFRMNVSKCLFSELLIAKYFLLNIFAIWSRFRMSFCGVESCRMAKLRKAVAE